MKYMLLIYGDDNALSEAEREESYVESTSFAHEIEQAGQFVATAPLYPAVTATTVQLRDGKRSVTDGPFAETREQLGGFFMVNVKDEAEALELAARTPAARWGTVEVRRVVELTGLPGEES